MKMIIFFFSLFLFANFDVYCYDLNCNTISGDFQNEMINLVQPLQVNSTLWFFGTVNKDSPKTSNVYIYRGSGNSLDSDEIAFHVEFNFATGWMSVTAMKDGVWQITRVIAAPFLPGKPFALQIRRTQYTIDLYASQQNWINFPLSGSVVLGNVRTKGDWDQNKITMSCGKSGAVPSTTGYTVGTSTTTKVPDLNCNIIAADFNNNMVNLTQTFDVGIVIWIWGTSAKSNPQNSEVFIYRGVGNTLDSKEIALHLEFNYNKMVVKLNSMQNGKWTAATSKSSPFMKTLPFALQLRRTATAIEIYSSQIYWMSLPISSSVVLGNLRTKGNWNQDKITQICPTVPTTTSTTTTASTTTTTIPTTTTTPIATTTTTEEPTTTAKVVKLEAEKSVEILATTTTAPQLAQEDTEGGYINDTASVTSTCNCPSSNVSSTSQSDIISEVIAILRALPEITIVNNFKRNRDFLSSHKNRGARTVKTELNPKVVEIIKILNQLPKIRIINNLPEMKLEEEREQCDEESSGQRSSEESDEDQCD